MFELAMPWALIVLPLPWLIWFLLPRAPTQLPAALNVPFFNAMFGIVESEKRHIGKQTTLTLLFLVWSLLLFALAGPRWVGEPRPLSRDGYNIMLALDISGSMEMSDMLLQGRPATRLAVVKRAAEQFVEDRAGDRIGLILFGTRAYLQTPLTYDRHSVLQRLDDATVGLAGETTSIGDALGLAVKRLQNVPEKGRMIILLTDGVNNSGGMFLNMNVTADLDEGTLKAVAEMTGGRYFRATDIQSLQSIYRSINQMETVSNKQAMVRPQHDYYPWPLAAALFLFLYWLAEKGALVERFKRGITRRGEVPQ